MNTFKIATILLIVSICFLHKIAVAQCDENEILNLRKTAIVFGEREYKYYGPLNNTINDAKDISDSLKKIGFTVYTYLDADLKSMNDAVDSWGSKLNNYDVALFYFSGHGAEVKGENFLFPTDINPKSPSDLNYLAFSANKLMETLDNSRLKYSIMILDACRNNPFTRGWSRDISNGGLAQMSGKGAFIAFAASPGKTASDGNKRNGVYTEGILKNITTPNKTISEIFVNVNGYVRTESKGEQMPFFNTSLGTAYCFSVSRTRKPTASTKLISFNDRGSGIAISPDNDKLFTIDDTKGEINVRDTKSLNIIRTLISGPPKPNFVIVAGTTLLVTDTANRSVSLIDWQQDKILHQFKLSFTPVSAILSPDQKKIFVCGNDKGVGYLTMIDAVSGKISAPLVLAQQIFTMSGDGKFLYLLPKDAMKNIILISMKSATIVNNSRLSGSGQFLAISPDNKRLFSGDQSKKKLYAIDLSTRKAISSLDISAKSIAFTNDARYLFAIDDERIAILRSSDGEQMRSLPFATIPNGITVGTDGECFVWLPKESRVFTFQLAEQLKNAAGGLDRALKLKKFQEEINSDPSLSEQIRKRDRCGQIQSYSQAFHQKIAYDIVGQFVYKKLNINFGLKNSSFPNPDCNKGTVSFIVGIQLNKNPSKVVSPIVNIQFTKDDMTLTLQDPKIDKIAVSITFSLVLADKSKQSDFSSFLIPLTPDDQRSLEKFVDTYFIDRLEYLK
jgi:hypothetical protein